MTIRLVDAAEADLRVALTWYRDKVRDLDQEFLQALDECLERIRRNPLSYGGIHGDIRRALLRRFPYCVFYLVSGSEIVVIACLHAHRDPQAWQRRRES